MSTELQNLKIDEVSGVDAPAHSIPGWMVMKAEGDAPLAAVETQLATLYASLNGASALAGAPEDVRKAAVALNEYVEAQLTAPEPEPTLIEKMKAIFKAKPKPVQPDPDNDNDMPGAEKPVKKGKKGAKVAQPDGDDDPTNTQDAQDVSKAVEKAVKKALKSHDEAHQAQLEEVAKAVGDELEGIREVAKALLDRIEGIENEMVGSYQVPGQDLQPVTKSAPSSADAVMAALHGAKVTLS